MNRNFLFAILIATSLLGGARQAFAVTLYDYDNDTENANLSILNRVITARDSIFNGDSIKIEENGIFDIQGSTVNGSIISSDNGKGELHVSGHSKVSNIGISGEPPTRGLTKVKINSGATLDVEKTLLSDIVTLDNSSTLNISPKSIGDYKRAQINANFDAVDENVGTINLNGTDDSDVFSLEGDVGGKDKIKEINVSQGSLYLGEKIDVLVGSINFENQNSVLHYNYNAVIANINGAGLDIVAHGEAFLGRDLGEEGAFLGKLDLNCSLSDCEKGNYRADNVYADEISLKTSDFEVLKDVKARLITLDDSFLRVNNSIKSDNIKVGAGSRLAAENLITTDETQITIGIDTNIVIQEPKFRLKSSRSAPPTPPKKKNGYIYTQLEKDSLNKNIKISLEIKGEVENGDEFRLIDDRTDSGYMIDLNKDIVDDYDGFYFIQKEDEKNDLIVVAVKGQRAGEEIYSDGYGVGAGSALSSIDKDPKASKELKNIISKIKSKSSQKEKSRAVRELAPEISGASIQGSINGMNLVNSALDSRVASVQNLPSGGSSVPTFGSTPTGGAVGGQANLGDTGVSSGDDTYIGTGVWGEIIGGVIKQSKRYDVSGFKGNTHGVTIGADKEFLDGFVGGVALSYNNTDIDGKDDSQGDKTEINSYGLTFYNGYTNKNLYTSSFFSATYNDYKSRRNIDFLNSQARSDYAGYQFSLKAKAGYRFDLGKYSISPEFGMNYTKFLIDSYKETGAGAVNLDVQSQNYDMISSEIGFVLSPNAFNIKDYMIKPQFRASWNYDITKERTEITASYMGSSTAFTTKGLDVEENTYKLGAGLDIYNDDNLSFNINYDASLRDMFVSHIGAVRARFDF